VYDLPQLEPILKDTYGVIVYQEQVMQIARSLAGYSLGQADLLRRAMGKKDEKEMARQKDQFLAGAKQQAIDPKKAEAIFDLMAKFAEYGFNKSHSAAYALIAYQTAYLKAHYPVEFMAALLSCDMDSTDKVLKSISDCREQGIEVLPPDINTSGQSFTVAGKSMRFGLAAVKGIGGGAVESIIEARKEGPFTDLYDFCERVDLRRVNKRVMEALIKCGAFDLLHTCRAPLMAALDDATAAGLRFQEERDSAQVSLFGDMPAVNKYGTSRTVPSQDEWHDKEKLAYEKEALGFLITGHPLDRYAGDIKRLATAEIARLPELPDGSEVRLCGIVTSLKEITTKKGDRMGFATIEDLTGQVEVTVFSDMYTASAALLKNDDPLLIIGKLEKGEKGCKLLVMKAQEHSGRKFQQASVGGDIKLLQEAQTQNTTRVCLNLLLPEMSAELVSPIRKLLEDHPGTLPVLVQLEIPNRSRTTIKLPDHLKVAASDELRLAVERCVGYNATIYE
jgi:DNA polymerase-3 subunit alpha